VSAHLSASFLDVLNVDLAIACVVAIAGGLVHGFSGFGVGLIVVPSLALVYGPAEAVAIASITSVTGAAPFIPGAFRVMNRPLVLPILVPTIIAVPVGSYLLVVADPLIMQRAIGILVFGIGLLLMVGFRWRGPRGIMAGLGVGTLGGLVGGSASVAGPIFSAYILSSEDRALTMRGGALVVASWVGAVTVVALAVGSVVDLETVIRAAILTLPIGLSMWAGAKLFARSSDTTYRRVACGLLLVAGMAAIVA
jgi:uncharacterized membrane protein YfcA